MTAQLNRRKRILVADNSITIQKLVHLSFAELNYEVLTASDGPDALSKAKTLRPEIVLADCKLDQMDGVAVCENIRKEKSLSKTRIILMKGKDDTSFEARIKSVKLDAILMKPFDSKSLIKIVEDFDEMEEQTVTTVVEKKLNDPSEETSTLVKKEDTQTLVLEKSERTLAPILTTETNASNDLEKIGEKEIREWIEKNLPAIAERLVKEEILRASQSS
ncbi:MAG: response regulator receiver protein [Bacteriovoracaceae bacterium]|nr:response regulator receiver protein [Bacteriovoracaceae bacterium]